MRWALGTQVVTRNNFKIKVTANCDTILEIPEHHNSGTVFCKTGYLRLPEKIRFLFFRFPENRFAAGNPGSPKAIFCWKYIFKWKNGIT